MTGCALKDERQSWGAERQLSEWGALPFRYLPPWGNREVGPNLMAPRVGHFPV